MGFRPVAKRPRVSDNPVDFFQDLRPRKIAALYDQQAQIMRDYAANAIDTQDVAIQGATGSGKTVVGLIIAEWRRRKFQERPVYLCPTRQLVHQVANFAQNQLGLSAYAFVGQQADFPPAQKTGWRSGEVLAIATYSALFNVNPFFSEPNFIVVDDAHAAEQYIAEYWTVRVSKLIEKQRPLFEMLAAILSRAMPRDEHGRLTEGPRGLSDHLWVQLVAGPKVYELESEIAAVLDEAPERSDLAYRWRVLKGNLKACQLLVSPYEIIIRPIVPPTGTHEPFNAAKQRLYMSATLGRGGELERLSGRKSIKRLPSPPGWDGHGVGRRFFMFPNASLTEDETDSFIDQLINTVEPKRALYLTPDDRVSNAVHDRIETSLPDFKVFSAHEIEHSKTPFVGTDKAVAVIANRYDGIDFPDDECRLLIIDDRPTGMNLLERYLSEKLTARALFAERTRTRIIQAFGRCTRSAKDYAIVCVTGQKLMDELLLSERRKGLDRDLQAELAFGEEQSKGLSEEEFLNLAELFLDQGEDWRGAEDQIYALREDMDERLPEALAELDAAARHEIDYVENLWNGNFGEALDAAQSAISSLAGGEALKGYRGMWHYLAGCAAHLHAREVGASMDTAYEHFRRARTIANIRIPIEAKNQAVNDTDHDIASEDQAAIERLEANLFELGLSNSARFTRLETQIRTGLRQDVAIDFEGAHEKLGDLLGFLAQNSEEQGAPDPRWSAGEHLCFVFEDHIKGTPGSALSLAKARQAAGHPKWIRANHSGLSGRAQILAVLVTNAGTNSAECKVHLDGVAVWPLEEFRSWATEVLSAIRMLRSHLSGPGDLMWRAEAITALSSLGATPSSLLEKLQTMRVTA